MPALRPSAVVTNFRGVALAVATASSTVAPIPASAQQDAAGQIAFDIPAQPLPLALGAFSHATGQAVLVDEILTSGRQSAAVKGWLAPGLALETLLQGSGLAVRYVNAGSFTLAPAGVARGSAPQSVARDAGIGADGRPSDYRSYFAAVQASLRAALCQRQETRPGLYRVGLRLWLGPSGAVTRSELLSSTGNRNRDAMLAQVLSTVIIDEPPPATLPQPVTVVLMGHRPETADECRPAEAGER